MSDEGVRKRSPERFDPHRPVEVPEGAPGAPWSIEMMIDRSSLHYRDGTWGEVAAREISDELRRQLGQPMKGPLMPATALTEIKIALTDGQGRIVAVTGRDAAGEWRYAVLGANGEPMVTSEGYSGDRAKALRGLFDLTGRLAPELAPGAEEG